MTVKRSRVQRVVSRIAMCTMLSLPLGSCQSDEFCLAFKIILGFCAAGRIDTPVNLPIEPGAATARPAAASVGDVIFVGGITPPGATTKNVEIFQSATKQFVAANTAGTARGGVSAVGFPSGPLSHHVLVPGGASGTIDDHSTQNFMAFTLTTTQTGDIYNAANGTFSASGVLSAARLFYTATLLNDGTVLVAGGFGGFSPLATAEIYNPATNTFTPTAGAMRFPRALHTATLLADGKVLIAGGVTTNYGKVLDNAELYNPHTKTFAKIPDGLGVRMAGHTAALISGCGCDADASVLLAGGFSGTGTTVHAANEASQNDTVVYSPTTKTFTAGPSMRDQRVFHTATTLDDGKVLLAGGMSGSVLFGFGEVSGNTSNAARVLKSAEIYNPANKSMTCLGGPAGSRCADAMHNPRLGHDATLLTAGPLQGRVLLAGGSGNKQAEIFNPANNSFTVLASQMKTQRAFSASAIVP